MIRSKSEPEQALFAVAVIDCSDEVRRVKLTGPDGTFIWDSHDAIAVAAAMVECATLAALTNKTEGEKDSE